METRKLVKMAVSHGEYREDFYGDGDTLLEAAEDAAKQSTYSQALFDITDNRYAARQKFRDELILKLAAGEPYRGYSWCTFTAVAVGLRQQELMDEIRAELRAQR